MLKLSKIAVTGGLSSGKSTVCQLFKEANAYIVSADEIVHQLLSPDTIIGQQVVDLLGSDIVIDQALSRKVIAEKVFSNRDKLKALEKIIHPAVLEEIENQYQTIKTTQNYQFFVAEIPLIYESETAHYFDYVLCIIADPKISCERFIQKTGQSEKEYEKRMRFQMPLSEKAAKADFTIINNGNLTDLKNQVYLLLKELRSQ